MKAALAVGAILIACAPSGSPKAAAAKRALIDACHYDVLVTADPVAVEVDAKCTGNAVAAFRASGQVAPYVEILGGIEVEPKGDRFVFEEPVEEARLRYRIDLVALGDAVDDFDVALHLRGGVVAPASTWLLRPDPTPAGEPVTVRVRTAEGAGFSTALPSVDGAYRLETHELRVATYAVFGKFESTKLELPGPGSLGDGPAGDPAILEIARLPAPMKTPSNVLERWIRDTAIEVGKFWEGFPVERSLVVVVPIRGREKVVFGKVLPAGGAGITILVGANASKEQLYDDWVLPHELFHLGFPSFVGEGKWLDEGLATYYEPIIRVRAGWMPPERMWKDFVDYMPRGMRALEEDGLEHSRGFGAIYWGGAIASLSVDVDARRASGGKRSLDDGVRAVRARGGTCQHVWALSDAIMVADDAMNGPFLSKFALTHADRGAPFELEKLLVQLGVERTMDGVVLHEDAPLAHIRRAIASPPNQSIPKRLR